MVGRPIGFFSRAWFLQWAAWPLGSIKANCLHPQVPHFFMSNIIPLPFESTLSSSYADASELAQAMQHLECHLAHVVNIWVTSKFPVSHCFLCADHSFVGLLESWPLLSGAEQFQMRELMDRLTLENQVIEGMMGQLHMVHNFNNMLIRWWDPGHVDTGNRWAAAAAWEQE